MNSKVIPTEGQREIVMAALDLLGDEGFQGLTIRRVAQQLGGSTTRVTHYYKNKEALLEGYASSFD